MKTKFKDINERPLIENLNAHINTGTIPSVKPMEDFFVRDIAIDSWFVIGHFESEGHTLNFLSHILLMNRPGTEPIVNFNMSITDETTGWHYSDDKAYPLNQVEIKEFNDISSKKMSIKLPNGILVGNLDEMHWEAEMPHGKINVDMKSYGMPIYNAGSGRFPTCFDMPFNQYSIPNLQTTGSIVMDNKVYEISGRSWFDRQWDLTTEDGGISKNNNQKIDSNELFTGKWNWSWMDLNLDNGDVLSLWDMNNITKNDNFTWATVLHPDGSQSIVTVENLAESASDFWTSEESKQSYPTHWTVRIPVLDAELEVTSIIKEQEIVSTIPFLNKYEGPSSVKGTYKGKNVTGYCYVELLGDWSK
ncbi:carotenoid 1,2-hydratase [Clostridium sp. SHJSY1]|uniref:lipocalin family protein n=1 Tax=Clostridium sp. SHJSY1 TaxID=2942483 RepID=UPI00287634D3|nr:lipocalin family protein [Clostridium sp. SHJSY1]MDS0526697.1 carotenoid 1,2-hydratase [Clostridium sp. SHJSY1]